MKEDERLNPEEGLSRRAALKAMGTAAVAAAALAADTPAEGS